MPPAQGRTLPQVPDRVSPHLLSVLLLKEAIMSQHPAHVSAATGEVRAKSSSFLKMQ